MVSDLVTHQAIHLSNPHINYVRLENCKYFKLERMKKYNRRRRLRRRNTSNHQVINHYSFDTIIHYYQNPIFEDVEVLTPLERVNQGSCIFINKQEEFCNICQDKISNWSICRKLKCGHSFHQECCDKWMEKNIKCPTCRFEI